jgi:hypothetical protein
MDVVGNISSFLPSGIDESVKALPAISSALALNRTKRNGRPKSVARACRFHQ